MCWDRFVKHQVGLDRSSCVVRRRASRATCPPLRAATRRRAPTVRRENDVGDLRHSSCCTAGRVTSHEGYLSFASFSRGCQCRRPVGPVKGGKILCPLPRDRRTLRAARLPAPGPLSGQSIFAVPAARRRPLTAPSIRSVRRLRVKATASQGPGPGATEGARAMNETTITMAGNLVADPELRYTPAGAAVVNFRIASTERFKGEGGWQDGDTLFMTVTAWRGLAENVAESARKGTRVIVTGRLRQRTYETREGEKADGLRAGRHRRWDLAAADHGQAGQGRAPERRQRWRARASLHQVRRAARPLRPERAALLHAGQGHGRTPVLIQTYPQEPASLPRRRAPPRRPTCKLPLPGRSSPHDAFEPRTGIKDDQRPVPRSLRRWAQVAMLSIHAGYDISYLTDAVGTGGADYYLCAAGQHGEPPGFWMGKGAAALGLSGEVDAKVMRALYHHDIAPDGSPLEIAGRPGELSSGSGRRWTTGSRPRWPRRSPSWARSRPSGRSARSGSWCGPEQRNCVPFFDLTSALEKSVSVTHASFLAAAKQAREAGDQAEAARCEAKAEADHRGAAGRRADGGAPGRGAGRLRPDRPPRRRAGPVAGRGGPDRDRVRPAHQPRR